MFITNQSIVSIFLYSSILLVAVSFQACNQAPISLQNGMTLHQSSVIKKDTFRLNGTDSLNQPVITIEGNDLVIDFNNAVLVGSNDKQYPNEFYGLAVLVKNGSNITIKNLNIHGYKVGLIAENVEGLTIENSDFSYNFRQKLKSIREREDLSDWLSYHRNDKDEWLRYGMGVYLKNCNKATVQDVRVTGGQNGLMLTGCDEGLFYNNTIHFNSGIGIGLYRSSNNKVMHNRLDWNIRGYSHGFYRRGQDSAGILCYEQSNENIFAYNSATHSGDGFFLWAGQTSMDTGQGGCNDNLIYANDFSFAPTNCVEITFSKNKVIGNKLEGCRYGVWAGYSFETKIVGNRIEGNDYGVAFEHGQNNRIEANLFFNDTVGIQLWEREAQPEDWGYAKAKDVSSRNYQINKNLFNQTATPLKISSSDNVFISSNQFDNFEELIVEEKPNAETSWKHNKIFQYIEDKKRPDMSLTFPDQLPKNIDLVGATKAYHIDTLADGMNAMLPAEHLKGKQYMLINGWGPYDFRYPVAWLREIDEDKYTILLLGPYGNWKITDAEGWTSISPKTGSFPATVVAERQKDAKTTRIDFEFIGEALTDQFGQTYKKGTPYPFQFYRYEMPLDWEVRWYEYDDNSHPLDNYEQFRQLKNSSPQKQEQTSDLAYTFWRSPGNDIHPDRFATFASTSFSIEKGKYKIAVTSDDGAKLFLDGKLLIDHWDIHVPATDEVEVELGGEHELEIEHFEGGGFSTLSFRLQKVEES